METKKKKNDDKQLIIKDKIFLMILEMGRGILLCYSRIFW